MNSDNTVPFIIRAAAPGDEGSIVALLRELAEYEKLLHRFYLTETAVLRDMLGTACRTDLAFVDGEAVAVATWSWIYKSFAARRGIFLEDLYVKPDHRGHGIGKAMLLALAQASRDAGGFLEWQVLDWNAPAIDFYKSLGATLMPDWITCRLQGEALERIAS